MIDLSKIYKKIQEDNLKFFEDGGPFEEEGVNTTDPDSPGYIGSELIAGDGNEWQANLPPMEGGIQPLTGTPKGVILPEFDLTQGGTSSTFRRDPNTETLEENLNKEIGTTPAPQSMNYDALSFGQAWRKANTAQGEGGEFTYRGKRFNTRSASASTSKPIETNVQKSKVAPTSKYTAKQAAEIAKQKAEIAILQKEYDAMSKKPNLDEEERKLNQKMDIAIQKQEIAKLKSGYESYIQTQNKKSFFRGPEVYTPAQKQARDIADQKKKIEELKNPTSFFRGPTVLTTAQKQAQAIADQKKKIEELKNPTSFFRGPKVNREMGGEIPEFLVGGPVPIPGQAPKTILTKEREEELKQQMATRYTNYIGTDGVSKLRQVYKPENILTATEDMKRSVFDPATGRQKELKINEGDRYDRVIDDFYNSDGQVTARADQEKQKMDIFSQLQTVQNYDVPEDLNMIGKSLAFEATDDKYTTDTSKKVAQGANLARGIFAGLDAVVGGGREIFSGYANQKRQQQTEAEFYRKQRKALEEQRTQFNAEGGEIQNILDMFGNEEEEDQKHRAPLSSEELLTGEYIQQNPNGAGTPPNAELEKNEYVQHNDGDVQRVIGRSHAQGGEKLALEPGTTVISDKVKLGAKNARALNKEYGLNVKAGDTYAKSIEKYTKKIGLEKNNKEQEEYFKKLKKVSDTKNPDPDTSEINNAFLSEKINDLSQKKDVLSASRSEFTEFMYQLQQESKSPRDRGETTEMQENGGQISYHADGDEIEPGMTLEEMVRRNIEQDSNSLDPRLGGSKWENGFYGPMDRWQQKLGLTPTKRGTHVDYQKDVTSLLSPQIIKLMKNGEMGLTNSHRAQLKKAGVTNADKIVSFKELSNEDLQKVGDTESFLKTGYEDGLPGHRGVTVLQGDATEEEYAEMTGEYDKLTDSEGRKVYAQYNKDGTIKRSSDGKLVFYYPKTGEKVPEAKAPSKEPEAPKAPKVPKKSPYTPPVIPPQRAIAPGAASPVPIYENRLDRYDPMKVGYDQQVSEIYRQANSVTPQLEGLTDTQRTAALANMSANTQKNIGDVVNSTTVQNAMSMFQNQQLNSTATDSEEAMRVANARAADEQWGKTEAFQEADNRDYLENVQALRIGRFNYMTKDRQMHDMLENYKVGADGGFEFDPSSAFPIQIGGVTYLKDANGNFKKVDTTKTDNKGNASTTSTTVEGSIRHRK